MQYKTSRLAGGFVLFYIEIKLSAKVEEVFRVYGRRNVFDVSFKSG